MRHATTQFGRLDVLVSNAAIDVLEPRGRSPKRVGPACILKLESYSAAKGGVNQLTCVMAVELAAARIRVNAIAPGYLENVMKGAKVEHADPETQRRIQARTPLGRRLTRRADRSAGRGVTLPPRDPSW